MSGANKRRLSEVIVVADDSTAPPPPPPEVLASWTVPPPALLEAWIAHHPELRGVLLRVLPGHWLGSIALNTIGRAMVDGSHLDGPAVWVNTDLSKHLDGGSIALLLKYLTPTWFSLRATELGHDAATLYHPLAWHTMYFPINKDDVHWALIVLRLGRLYLLDSQERASILDIAAHGILNWLTRFYAINNFLGLDVVVPLPAQIHKLSCPQQRDGWACGWFTLFFARRVLAVAGHLTHVVGTREEVHDLRITATDFACAVMCSEARSTQSPLALFVPHPGGGLTLRGA
jgi:hypothetical protein